MHEIYSEIDILLFPCVLLFIYLLPVSSHLLLLENISFDGASTVIARFLPGQVDAVLANFLSHWDRGWRGLGWFRLYFHHSCGVTWLAESSSVLGLDPEVVLLSIVKVIHYISVVTAWCTCVNRTPFVRT